MSAASAREPNTSSHASDSSRTLWLVTIAIAFLGALLIYARGAAPGLLWADSGEMQVAGLTGGIPHPSGYPSFVLFGRLFALLPFPDHAYRITFMTGFFGAITLAVFVAAMRELGAGPWTALCGAMIFGASFTFWAANLRAEVYTVATAFFMVALWRMFAYLHDHRRRDRLIAALFLGLTVTGHLSFVFPVAVLGLVLAWRTFREERRPIGPLTVLLAVFLLGLTPFLYIPWADTHAVPYSYLRLVDQAQFAPGAPRPAWFRTTWDRFRWLLFARDIAPPVRINLSPRTIERNLFDCVALLCLFDLGPVGAVLAFPGAIRLWSTRPLAAGAMVAVAVISVAFTAQFGIAELFPIFMLAATLAGSVLAAFGIAWLIGAPAERLRLPAFAAALLTVIMALLVQLSAHALRLRSETHPIGGRWQYSEEAGDTTPSLIPSRRGFDEPERFGDRLMALIPPHALVISNWSTEGVIYYYREVLGQRRDLTFQPAATPGVLFRIRDWAARHDLSRAPIVFVSPAAVLSRGLAASDSIRVLGDHWMVVLRPPLDESKFR